MFIVNSDGNICEEVKSFYFEIQENSRVAKQIERKREEIKNSLLGLNIHICSDYVERHLQEYINNLKEDVLCIVIYINEKPFGNYKIKNGKIIFDEMIHAIEKNKPLFDLRDYEKMNED